MKLLIKIFKSKVFWANLVIIALVLWIGISCTLSWLKSYTHHGETRTVPSLVGFTMDDAVEIMEENKLRYVVMDTIFNEDLKPGEVVEHVPSAGDHVKENRTIYLVINDTEIPLRKLPAFYDELAGEYKWKTYQKKLQVYFKVGELIYRPDIGENIVLELQVNGEVVAPGTMLKQGTEVDVVIGAGSSESEKPVPDLLGMAYQEASWQLKANSFNVGSVFFDETIGDTYEDTMDAKVYDQRPLPFTEENQYKLKLGEAVDLFLTKELPEDFWNDTLDLPDSTNFDGDIEDDGALLEGEEEEGDTTKRMGLLKKRNK